MMQRKIHRRTSWLLGAALAWLLVVGSGSAWAQSFTVYAANLPPFSYQDENGLAQGISVDILLEMLQRIGQPVDRASVKFIAWPRAVAKSRENPGSILLTPAKTPDRADDFYWIGPVHTLQLGLIGKKSKAVRIDDVLGTQGLKVSAIRNSASIYLLHEKYGIEEKSLVLVTDDEQQFAMLDRDRVDLVSHGRSAATFFLRKIGLDPDDFEMVDVLRELDLYIAINPRTDPNLLEGLTAAFEDLHDKRQNGTSEYSDIIERQARYSPLDMAGPRR